jgi:hypothetical protein
MIVCGSSSRNLCWPLRSSEMNLIFRLPLCSFCSSSSSPSIGLQQIALNGYVPWLWLSNLLFSFSDGSAPISRATASLSLQNVLSFRPSLGNRLSYVSHSRRGYFHKWCKWHGAVCKRGNYKHPCHPLFRLRTCSSFVYRSMLF